MIREIDTLLLNSKRRENKCILFARQRKTESVILCSELIKHSTTEQHIQIGKKKGSTMGSHINHNDDIIEMTFKKKKK